MRGRGFDMLLGAAGFCMVVAGVILVFHCIPMPGLGFVCLGTVIVTFVALKVGAAGPRRKSPPGKH